MGLIVLAWLGVINIVGFALMGIDKKKAQKHLYRIPEAVLFLVAIIGGSIGSWIGMYVFRHKTRKWYFVIGMPLILVLEFILLRIANG